MVAVAQLYTPTNTGLQIPTLVCPDRCTSIATRNTTMLILGMHYSYSKPAFSVRKTKVLLGNVWPWSLPLLFGATKKLYRKFSIYITNALQLLNNCFLFLPQFSIVNYYTYIKKFTKIV